MCQWKKLKITSEESRVDVDWTNLPKDIVKLVMEKLVWSDRFRMCLFCKRWQECLQEIDNAEEFLPWVMCYNWFETNGSCICKLYDPASNRSYAVKEAPNLRDLYGALPVDSRHGWVLFSKQISDTASSVFFYNPFTNEVIELPKIEREYCQGAAFSSRPNSPDCTVIFMTILETRELKIQTCQPGDKSWNLFQFSGEYECKNTLKPVYAGDSFYCISSDGKMGAFDIKQQEWKLFPERLPAVDYYDTHLVVTFKGDLLRCWGRSRIRNHRRFQRFDISKTKWVSADDDSMKKQVIYREGRSNSFTFPAVGNAKESAGKMYSLFYFTSPLSSFFYLDGGYETASKHYKILENDKMVHVWIQPPFQQNFNFNNF